MTFSIIGEDGAECVEGVDSIKYLGWILSRADKYWPSIIRNIRRARQVWGKIVKLLRWEGADTIISLKFYRMVVWAVLIFGSETWVLKAVIMQKLEGLYVVFLLQVKRENTQSQG